MTGLARKAGTGGAAGTAGGGTYTVFLDRDGVFNRLRLPGTRRPEDLEWLPGVPEAFARLNRPDVRTCLVTNQPQVGHLLATPAQVRRVNDHLRRTLEAAGGRLDRVEASHSPAWFPHRRRKPRPGMLEDGAAALASSGHPVDKRRACMVGDSVRDAQAAAAFGIPCILLATTHPETELRARLASRGVEVWAVEPDLPAAVERILGAVAARGAS